MSNFRPLYSKTPGVLDKIFSLSPVISALDSSKLGVFPKSFFNKFSENSEQLALLSSDARSWITAQGYHILVDGNGKETGISTDTTKPVFMQAFVSGGHDITLTFNEPLMPSVQEDAQASPKSFKVINSTRKDIKYTVDEVINTSSEGKYEVTIKLLTSDNLLPVEVIDPKHHLLLSYTDPSKGDDWNARQDSSGNDLISLTGINVINNGFGS